MYTHGALLPVEEPTRPRCVYMFCCLHFINTATTSRLKRNSLSLSLPGLFLVGCRARRAAAADSVQLLSFSSISFAAEQVERWNYMDSIVY